MIVQESSVGLSNYLVFEDKSHGILESLFARPEEAIWKVGLQINRDKTE